MEGDGVMPIKSVMVTAAVAALTLGVPAAARDDALPQYKLDLTLYDGSRIVGKPSMVVEAWTANRIAVNNPDGSHYHASFSVEPMDEEKLRFISRFDVSSAAVGDVQGAPMIEVEPGKPIFIALGRDAGAHKEFRAEMTISKTGH
jgi:hypothetical protein